RHRGATDIGSQGTVMQVLTKLLVSLRRHGAVLAIGLVCAAAGPVHAQTATGDDGAPPPARVARLSYVAADLGLLDLNDQMAQIELTQGTLNLSVQSLDDGQSYEIDTPTVALVINQPG